MTNRTKILSAAMALVGLATVAAGIARAPGVNGGGGEAPVLPVQARWTSPPRGVIPDLWKPAVRPPQAPPTPALRPAPPADREVTLTACYAPGTAGYESICQNPGFYQTGYGGAHWGDEPYYASGIRYVWVRDSLTDQRTREWLHYWVNVQNQKYLDRGDKNGTAYVLEQAENLGGGPRGTCLSTTVQQWIDVCPTGDARSSAVIRWIGDHFSGNTVRISTTAIGKEYRIQNAVYHEMGHAIGFAHDTNCESVMTYCSTYGTKYLYYAGDQDAVVRTIYDNHTN